MQISTKSLRRFLEVLANLGIIIVAVILIGNFVSSKWRTKHDVTKLTAGSKVSLSGLNGKMERLSSWHFKEAVNTAMGVRLSIVAYFGFQIAVDNIELKLR